MADRNSRRRAQPEHPLYHGGTSQSGSLTAQDVLQFQSALAIAWSQITGTPTTLAGYGITDAYTDAEVDALIAAAGGALSGLSDVDLTGLADGDILRYDLASGLWKPEAPGVGGGGSIDGSGTAGAMAKWIDADTLGDSLFSDDGTDAEVSGKLLASLGVIFDGGTFEPGKVYGSATYGLIITGKTGTDAEFLLANNAGSGVADIELGTNNFRLYGKLLPVTDAVSDLGSASKQFKDLYLSGAINIDGVPISTGVGASPTGHHAGTTSIEIRYAAGQGAVTGALSSTALAVTSNRIYLVPFIAPSRGGTIDQLSIIVSVAAALSSVNLGIYDTVSETDLMPNALLASGSVSTTSTGAKTLAVSQALTPGRVYYLACQATVAGVTINALPNGSMAPILTYSNAGSARVMFFTTNGTATLPATIASVSDLTGVVPALFYRFSA